MCHSDVGFEVSGGGYGNPDVAKFDQQLRHLKRKAEQMENGPARVSAQKEVTDKQNELKAMKENLAEERHNKQLKKLDDIETLIMNPLDGALVNEEGYKRSLPELRAFVMARQRQEDILMAQMEKDEAAAAKTQIDDAKKSHALEIEKIKASTSTRKEELKAEIEKEKAAAEKEKAAAEKERAAANKEKAAAEKEKAEAEKEKAVAEKAAAEAEKAKSKSEKKDKKEKKEKKEKKDKGLERPTMQPSVVKD